MFAIILNIPCTDDMLLFNTKDEAERWLEKNGPWEYGDFSWGLLTRPEDTIPWRRN